jgi:hypothetical protein
MAKHTQGEIMPAEKHLTHSGQPLPKDASHDNMKTIAFSL